MKTQIVASAACSVGCQEFHSWIASLPLVSLLSIVIPNPFLNFLIFIYFLFIYFLLYNRICTETCNLVLMPIISLCMCHTHFCNEGASFLYCSIAFKKALTLP